jgi:predicted hotdog family 3-hydroxylacyl-ACP dehydratase
MTHDVNWSSYAGSSSSILAGVLLLATVILTYVGVRFRQGKPGIRPGKFLGALLISSFVLAILTFLTAVTAYGLADVQQGSISRPQILLPLSL